MIFDRTPLFSLDRSTSIAGVLICLTTLLGLIGAGVSVQQNQRIANRDIPKLRFAIELSVAVHEIRDVLSNPPYLSSVWADRRHEIQDKTKNVHTLLSGFSPDDTLIGQWDVALQSINRVIVPLNQRANLTIRVDGNEMTVADFISRLTLGNAISMNGLRKAVEAGDLRGIHSDPRNTPFNAFTRHYETDDPQLSQMIDGYASLESRILDFVAAQVVGNPVGAHVALLDLNANLLPEFHNAAQEVVWYVDRSIESAQKNYQSALGNALGELDRFSNLAAAYQIAAETAMKSATNRAKLANQFGIGCILVLVLTTVYALRSKTNTPNRARSGLSGKSTKFHQLQPEPQSGSDVAWNEDRTQRRSGIDQLGAMGIVLNALSRRADQFSDAAERGELSASEVRDLSRQLSQAGAVFRNIVKNPDNIASVQSNTKGDPTNNEITKATDFTKVA